MARGDRDRTKERDLLRTSMEKQGCTREQIATAMARQFGDRPRQAWRHAHGWTQQEAASRYNQEVNDKQASMSSNRISDHERWPINGAGVKPTVVPTLAVLAQIYATSVSKLVDRHDRQNMNNGELIGLAIIDSGITPQQLPSVISNFVGRVHELNILTAQLDHVGDNSSGPVVITSIGGTAGIGKTTLAVYWARAHIDQFPDGQLYVDLHGFDPSGTPITPATAIRGFLDAFQVPPEKIPLNPEDQAALYRTLVAGKQLVIVLDNARDSDQVWPLLPGSPNCTVLVTSRQQLGSLIAHQQAVHITLEFMTTAEARQLLIGFLGPERIHAEPDAVDELIQLCVGLPMVLSIAAARILLEPHLPLSTLVSQLRDQHRRLDALSTGDSQLTDIRAVFSWSYTAVTPQAARLFRLLGLHPGPDIGTLAAASLAGLPEHDTDNLLTELTRAHLLDQHIPGRYQFHDLLRVYATEQATTEESEPQRRTALQRVLDYYLHTGFAAEQYLAPHRKLITLEPPQLGTIPRQIISYEQAVEWFTTEHAVLLAAINYAAAHSFDIYAWQLPWTLATFFYWQGHWHDFAAIQQTAMTAAGRLDDPATEALAHRELGMVYTRLRRYADALASLQQGLTLYRELGDRDGQADIHLALGMVCERQAQYTQALTHAQHALDFSRITGHHAGQARALNNLGWNYALLGHYQQTITHCQQALNLFRELDERRGEAHTLDSLGYAHHHFCQHGHSLTCYQQALTLYREFGDRYGEATTLTHLGDTHYAMGNLSAARDTWQQALTILDRLGHPDAEQVRAKLASLDTDPDESTAGDQL